MTTHQQETCNAPSDVREDSELLQQTVASRPPRYVAIAGTGIASAALGWFACSLSTQSDSLSESGAATGRAEYLISPDEYDELQANSVIPEPDATSSSTAWRLEHGGVIGPNSFPMALSTRIPDTDTMTELASAKMPQVSSALDIYNQLKEDYPLATPRELASMHAITLCEQASQDGEDAIDNLGALINSLYPQYCDFELVRIYLKTYEEKFPSNFAATKGAHELVNSRFKGTLTAELAQDDAGSDIAIMRYSVRRFEHPSMSHSYDLDVDVTFEEVLPDGKRIPLSGHGYSGNMTVIPSDKTVWRSSQKFALPNVGVNSRIQFNYSMKYSSYTNHDNSLTYLGQGNARALSDGYDHPALSGSFQIGPVQQDIDSSDPSRKLSILGRESDFLAVQKALSKSRTTSDMRYHTVYQTKLAKTLIGKPLTIPIDESVNLAVPWRPSEQSGESQFERPTLVEFSSMGCRPCLAALPELGSISRNEDLFDVLVLFNDSISPDRASDKSNPPIAITTTEFYRSLGIRQYPSYLVVDKKGIIRAVGHSKHMQPGYSLLQQLLEEE